MINKTIYYCWFGKNKKGNDIISNIESWRETNPDYKIVEINEKNFDCRKYKFSLEAYENKKWAFVSDVARMDVLFNLGGFCLDTDVKLISSLDSLRKNRSVWCLETSGLIGPGLIIGVEKGDQDLKNILDIYRELSFDSKNAKKTQKSPDIVTGYFKQKNLGVKNKNQVLEENELVLASDYFAPYHWWGGGHVTKRTIGIHQYANSWGADLKVSKKQKLMRNWKHKFPESYFFIKKCFDHIK